MKIVKRGASNAIRTYDQTDRCMKIGVNSVSRTRNREKNKISYSFVACDYYGGRKKGAALERIVLYCANITLSPSPFVFMGHDRIVYRYLHWSKIHCLTIRNDILILGPIESIRVGFWSPARIVECPVMDEIIRSLFVGYLNFSSLALLLERKCVRPLCPVSVWGHPGKTGRRTVDQRIFVYIFIPT